MSDFFVPVTVVLFILFLSSFFYWAVRARMLVLADNEAALAAQAQLQAQVRALNQGPQQPELKGLDQRIIDSYPTVVIGESGRMIKPDDNTCPICLADYLANDVLKILPECLHRYHAECLDEWLRFNASCPVCRVHPPHTTSQPA